MPIPALALLAGGQALTGLVSGIAGLGQKARAKKLAAQNARPDYQIPQEVLKNQKIAEQMSLTGLPSAQLQQAKQNIQQNAANAIGAAKDRRGGIGAIGAVQGAVGQQLGKLSAEDAAARLGNISNLMKQNQVLAGYRDKVAQDQMTKYRENAAAIRAMQTAGNANLFGGINSILGAGATAVSGGLFDKAAGAAKVDAPIGGMAKPSILKGFTDATPELDIASMPVSSEMQNAITEAANMKDPTLDSEQYSQTPAELLKMLNSLNFGRKR